MEPIIRVEGLTHTYGQDTPFCRSAVDGVSLEIYRGEFLGIIGHTGSGKSTLIQHLNGLLQPTVGKIYLDGKDITDFTPKQRDIGMVFQQYSLFPTMTVRQNVAFGLQIQKMDKARIQEKVRQVLEIVGLSEKIDHYPRQLSGGQQQRVAIARALASEAPVILADEPTGNLDEDTAQDITDILKESAHKMNKCVVVVTHSNELAKQADVVFRLKKGELQVLERVQDGAAQPQSRRNNAPRSERRAH